MRPGQYIRTSEIREKQRVAMRNFEYSDEYKKRLSKNLSSALSGKKKSEEHKKKIGQANMGKRTGQKASIELRRKLSERQRGEKSHLWKGGLTKKHQLVRGSSEYKIWRESVFERDGYACVLCGDARGGNLNADHIKPFAYYPELRFNVENGRTLCVECHRGTDTYGTLARKHKPICVYII